MKLDITPLVRVLTFVNANLTLLYMIDFSLVGYDVVLVTTKFAL